MPGKTICSNFCSYYNPGKSEELACRGYLVIERMMREGKTIPLERTYSASDPETTEVIVRKLCSLCDFRIDGCDFINDRNAPPCGGFLLLSQLLSEDIITIDDI